MTTVYDVPPGDLIKRTAQKLKERKEIEPPSWAPYVKTGAHKELQPSDSDWWYVRCASILRRIYIDGPVGVSRLRSFYGGKHRNGVTPPVFSKGSGSIPRTALQQLEKAGYVRSSKSGRVISQEGRSFLDNIAHEIKGESRELRSQESSHQLAESMGVATESQHDKVATKSKHLAKKH